MRRQKMPKLRFREPPGGWQGIRPMNTDVFYIPRDTYELVEESETTRVVEISEERERKLLLL